MPSSPRFLAAVVVALAALLAAACSSADPGSQPVAVEDSAVQDIEIPERYALQQALDFTMTLTTTSVGGTFGRLDRKHTCERGDTSPHIAWKGVPEGAKSLALVVEDPRSDINGFDVDVLWTHWVVYAIPPDVTEFEPGQLTGDLLENGSKQGANDYEQVQYNGPCPIPRMVFPTHWSAGGVQSSRASIVPEEPALSFQAVRTRRPHRSSTRGRPRRLVGGHRRTSDGCWTARHQLQVNQEAELLLTQPGHLSGSHT